MSQPFLGQIQSFGFGFAPRGWMLCNGQTLSIQQYTALFSLIGTNYGGNGTTTFQLPNLQSRVPMHQGTAPAGDTYVMGEQGGVENVTVLLSNLPMHNHSFVGTSQNANTTHPSAGTALANIWSASGAGNNYYTTGGTPQALNPAELAPVGGNQPHPNIQPYLAISWCIAINGVYPARS